MSAFDVRSPITVPIRVKRLLQLRTELEVARREIADLRAAIGDLEAVLRARSRSAKDVKRVDSMAEALANYCNGREC